MEKMCYWLTAKSEEGKPYLIFGSAVSEDEARQKGMEMLGGLDFQIHALRTRNLQRASSMLKGNRLEKTKSLKKAAEHLGHDRSITRDRKRRAARRKAKADPNWP